ncbi:MAG: YjjG family noncanonical pyrimidine nucleotidase [Bacteroidaceae bacterium]|nr:YjjG family noncanonical pyrimidine nucleotidase [Bacteroidaceae bacterium]
MKKYSDLFFDFDDTLYDTHGNAIIALHELYNYFHLDRYFEKVEDFTEPYLLANLMLWSQYSAGKIDRPYLILERFRRPLSNGKVKVQDKEGKVTEKPLEPSEDFCHQVGDKFLELCSCKSGVVPGAYELLNYLKGKGYRMHICSNGFHEVQYKKLHSSNLYDYFDTIILSEDAGANKPSPTFFDYAFEISGAKPETTLMIGDNFITDIQGAKKAGIDVMFYNAHPDDFTSPEPVNFEVHNLLEIKNIL